MPGYPGGLGWHPPGKNWLSEPIPVTDMTSSARGKRFVTTIIDLAALNGLTHRAKCHNKLLFSSGWFTTSCWFILYQKCLLFSIYFLLMMLFLMCSSSSWCCSVLPISRRHFSLIDSQTTAIARPPMRERYGCLSWVPSVTEVSPLELFC